MVVDSPSLKPALFSRALHQLIQDGMAQESLEMEGDQGCVTKSHPADPEHPSPPTQEDTESRQHLPPSQVHLIRVLIRSC